jgi:hypothetical protein
LTGREFFVLRVELPLAAAGGARDGLYDERHFQSVSVSVAVMPIASAR